MRRRGGGATGRSEGGGGDGALGVGGEGHEGAAGFGDVGGVFADFPGGAELERGHAAFGGGEWEVGW